VGAVRKEMEADCQILTVGETTGADNVTRKRRKKTPEEKDAARAAAAAAQGGIAPDNTKPETEQPATAPDSTGQAQGATAPDTVARPEEPEAELYRLRSENIWLKSENKDLQDKIEKLEAENAELRKQLGQAAAGNGRLQA
jgi:predicted RNase H-like nuclease (RuvC/YqgF family)